MSKFDFNGNEISRWKWTGKRNSEHYMEILKFYDKNIGEWQTYSDDVLNMMLSYPFIYDDQKLLFDDPLIKDLYYKYFVKKNSLKIYETNHPNGKRFKRYFVKISEINKDITLVRIWKSGKTHTLEFLDDNNGRIIIKNKNYEIRAEFTYHKEKIKMQTGLINRLYDGYFEYDYSVDNICYYSKNYYRIEGNKLFLSSSCEKDSNFVIGELIFEYCENKSILELKYMINNILAEWDPIGVPFFIKFDEYADFVEPIFLLGNNEIELEKYLIYLIDDYIGLGFDKNNEKQKNDIHRVVGKIIALYK
jgi:hypothetical protein